MRLPDRRELLDYVEGVPGQDAQVQKNILQLLASSRIMREQLVELKRDLYMVSTQIPEYMPSPTIAAEVTKLAQAWIQVLYNRKFALRNFYRTQEFFWLLCLVGAAILGVLTLLGWNLLGA